MSSRADSVVFCLKGTLMAKQDDFGDINLDVSLGRQPSGRASEQDSFRIAVLGDFSGRASRGLRDDSNALAARRPQLVDRDNFDDVFRSCRVELELPVAGRIQFSELDDFHPDRLWERVPLFDSLRQARAQVASPRPARVERPSSGSAPPPSAFALGDLLDQAVEATAGRAEGKPSAGQDPLRAWLDETVAPYAAPKVSGEAASRQALVDQAATLQMRALMHYPHFQDLEALWRALFFLVRRLETGSRLSVWLVDVTRDELAADLEAAPDAASSGIHRLLARGEMWALLAGAYTLGGSGEDFDLLEDLGELGASFGISWLSGAHPGLIGCDALAPLAEPREWRLPDPAWEELRRRPAARHIGLTLPRFLLRLPYGAQTGACEKFPFEEMGDEMLHDRLLWGNPAIACACLLGETFAEEEWAMRPGRHLNLARLPFYIYQQEGESIAQPCAETLMTELAAHRILERGPMPLATLKGSGEVRLVRFQSIGNPVTALPGPWTAGSR
jgi:type VI secretion system protein ImpC